MPVVTAILGPEIVPTAETTERFTSLVAQHCQAMMGVPPDKVQVQLLQAIAPLHGAAVYLGVQYRQQSFCDGALMDSFMAALEAACVEAFRVTPRIRCFPLENGHLFARN